MTRFNDLYGAHASTVDEVAEQLTPLTGQPFQRRESWYQGGDYCVCELADGEAWRVQYNRDPVEGDDEPREPQFAAYPVLLYLGHTARAEALEAHLRALATGLVLLRRRPDVAI